MIRERGYTASVMQVRRAVARLRPPAREAFLRLHTFHAEQAPADWAHFGHVAVGRAKRALSCFVMTLSCSRALYPPGASCVAFPTFLEGGNKSAIRVGLFA
jgi:transposase